MLCDCRGAMDRYIGGLLLAALLVRGGLDLFWWVNLGGFSPGQVVSAALVVLFYGLAAPSWREIPPMFGAPALVFTLLVGGACFRGPDDSVLASVRWALLYLGPLAFGAAVITSRVRAEIWIRAILVAACVPLVWALILLAAGQPQELFLHGYHRLLGPYKNHHMLAVISSGVGSLSVYAVFREKGPWRLLGLATGIACAICLFNTYVRTSWLLIAGFVALWLVAEKRWSLVGLATALGLAAFALSPTLQDRFSDVANLVTLTPPEAGWGSLGSSRLHIWTDSFANFSVGGWSSFAFGNGLGAHMVLHKELDPHSEYLALLYQLGLAGPITYLWLFGAAAFMGLRRGTALGNYVFALAVMTAVTCLISNDFLTRVTFAWWFWAVVALAWTDPAEGLGDRRNQDQSGDDSDGLGDLGGQVG